MNYLIDLATLQIEKIPYPINSIIQVNKDHFITLDQQGCIHHLQFLQNFQQSITQIVQQQSLLFLLSSQGQVYTLPNSQIYQNFNQIQLKQIENLNQIKQIIVNSHSAFALDKNGLIFTWGQNMFNLPNQLETIQIPIELKHCKLKNINYIQCEENSLIAITQGGRAALLEINNNRSNLIIGNEFIEDARYNNSWYFLTKHGNIWKYENENEILLIGNQNISSFAFNQSKIICINNKKEIVIFDLNHNMSTLYSSNSKIINIKIVSQNAPEIYFSTNSNIKPQFQIKTLPFQFFQQGTQSISQQKSFQLSSLISSLNKKSTHIQSTQKSQNDEISLFDQKWAEFESQSQLESIDLCKELKNFENVGFEKPEIKLENIESQQSGNKSRRIQLYCDVILEKECESEHSIEIVKYECQKVLEQQNEIKNQKSRFNVLNRSKSVMGNEKYKVKMDIRNKSLPNNLIDHSSRYGQNILEINKSQLLNSNPFLDDKFKKQTFSKKVQQQNQNDSIKNYYSINNLKQANSPKNNSIRLKSSNSIKHNHSNPISIPKRSLSYLQIHHKNLHKNNQCLSANQSKKSKIKYNHIKQALIVITKIINSKTKIYASNLLLQLVKNSKYIQNEFAIKPISLTNEKQKQQINLYAKTQSDIKNSQNNEIYIYRQPNTLTRGILQPINISQQSKTSQDLQNKGARINLSIYKKLVF